MLQELAKKDALWRRIAFNIARDKSTADDLVQEMYIKLADCNKEINDFYVAIVIKNIFLDEIRKNKTVSLNKFDVVDNHKSFELEDKEQELLNSLKWWEKDLIELTFDNSLHQIERDYNINYQFTRRVLIKAKNKWQEKK
jgi:DNA-directed RNA polymerase specialized sigma24 family protein